MGPHRIYEKTAGHPLPGGRQEILQHLLCGIAHDGFGFEEVLKPVIAPFAAIARLLIPAKRRVQINGCPVQVHIACPQL